MSFEQSHHCSSSLISWPVTSEDSDPNSMASEDEPVIPAKRRKMAWRSTSHSSHNPNAFWFNDGDIVLEIDQRRFKVHQVRLRCSVVFSDMLGLPQPADAESVDGCPLVHLADAAEDWTVTLKWLYDPSVFRSMPHPMPFQFLRGALRISTKYDMPDLRKTMITLLKARWPFDLERMDTTSLPHAAEAISLARECDVPEILPAAFYALSIQRWGFNAEGGQSHQVLSAVDMRRLIIGRERLSSLCSRILLDPLIIHDVEVMPVPFDACVQCKDPLQRYWREKVCANPSSLFECWLLHELHKLLKEGDPPFESNLCVGCLGWHRDAVVVRFYGLKESIPHMFHLPSEP